MKRLHRPILRAGAGGYGFIRSLNPAAWFRADTGVTVTGLGVSTWADQSGNGRDLLQGTDANRPPYLSYSASSGKYLYLPGVAGNYASTPDSVPLSITGDIEFIFRIAAADYTPSADNRICCKRNVTTSWDLHILATSGLFTFYDGANTLSVATAPTATDGTAYWFKASIDVDNGSGSKTFTLYQAADSASIPSSWTTVGAVSSGTAGALTDTDNSVLFGVFGNGSTAPFNGRIYRAIIKSGIDGTTVADFNPDLDGSDQAATITSSATGEVWTINKSGGLPAQIVATSRLLGDGSGDKMATNAYVADQPRTRYIVCQAISWTAGDYLISGTGAEAGVTQVTATPQIGLNAGSAAAANSGLVLNEKHVVCAVLDGADSLLQIDLDTPSTGNAGTNDPDGIALFANQAGSGYFNGMVWEILDFDTAHDATQRSRVIQYCAGRHGIAL